jgi:uncharacterized membrane protein
MADLDRTRRTRSAGAHADQASRVPGLLMGLGAGGLLDGVVLHQVLQWHHLISDTDGNPVTTVGGLEANTLADGLFHIGTMILLVLGIIGLHAAWRQGRWAPSTRFQLGLVLAGWGVFNLVEGTINHLVLGVHHVRDDLGGPLSWDVGFLVFGAALVVAGTLVHRSGEESP